MSISEKGKEQELKAEVKKQEKYQHLHGGINTNETWLKYNIALAELKGYQSAKAEMESTSKKKYLLAEEYFKKRFSDEKIRLVNTIIRKLEDDRNSRDDVIHYCIGIKQKLGLVEK